MKPILLKMQAFGSYAEEAVVDFTQFTSGLYWITGDTGAGKTTIFDAIVFALYGKASGSSRQMWMLHSDFVPLSTKTEVELVFEHRGCRNTVSRTIKYSKRRGTADSYGEAKQDATLKEGDKDPVEGAQKVTDRVQELLGMDINQFRKIVMLAQGEFQEFLKADSKDRGAILGKLFDSSPYRAFQRRLSGAERALNDQRAEIRNEIKAVMKAFRVPEGLDEEQQARFDPDHPQLVEYLEALLESDKAALKERKTERERADEARVELTKQQQAAAEHNKKLDTLAATRKRRQELREQRDEMDALRAQYDAAEKAWRRVRPAERRATERKCALEELLGRINELETKLERAKKEEQTQSDAVEANAEVRTQIDALKVKIEEIRKALPVYEELEGACEVLREAEQEVSGLECKYLAEEQALKEIEASLQEIKAELETLEGIDGAAEKAEHARDTAQDVVEQLSGENGLQNQVDQLMSDESELARKGRELEQLTAQACDAEDKHHRLYQSFLAGQAGEMARNLAAELDEKGYGICPVCRTEFSRAHHHAFAAQAEGVPTQDQVEEARRQWQAADQARHEADRKQTERKVNIESRKEQALKLARGLLGMQVDWETLSAEGCLAAAITRAGETLEAAERTYREQEAKQKRRRELREKQDKQTEEKTDLDKALKDLQSELDRAKETRTTSQTKKTEIEKRLPYPCRAKAEAEIQRLEGEKEGLQKQVDAAQTAWNRAKETLDRTQGELKAEKEKLPDAESDAYRAEQEQTALVNTEFGGDPAAYQMALEPIGKEDGEDWLKRQEARLVGYRTECRDNERDIQKLEEETAGWMRSDLEMLDKRLSQAKELYQAADQAYSACVQLMGNHDNTLEQVRGLRCKLEHMRGAYDRLRYLSTLANGGQSDEDGRLSFERYVMGSVFREILEQANVRLSIMSGGKYELIHVLQEQGGRSNAQSGLGIELLDLTTGKQRTTGSISGGESFVVSMALALGLSDVVQNRSGGSTLEAMFIDEGFGSLDDRVLDTAISVLEQLAGGNRLVGVISHVEKLEECIAQRIYVTNGEKGSHLKVQA